MRGEKARQIVYDKKLGGYRLDKKEDYLINDELLFEIMNIMDGNKFSKEEFLLVLDGTVKCYKREGDLKRIIKMICNEFDEK